LSGEVEAHLEAVDLDGDPFPVDALVFSDANTARLRAPIIAILLDGELTPVICHDSLQPIFSHSF
jgi:hypothetical protein